MQKKITGRSWLRPNTTQSCACCTATESMLHQRLAQPAGAQRLGWGGEKGFDPLGVTDALPVYWVREAELKHGRVCMLATVGWIATDLGARFPGEKFQSVANSVEAHDKMVEAGYMLPFLGAIGIFELFSLWLFFQSWPIGDGINREAGGYWLGKQFLPFGDVSDGLYFEVIS